MVDMKVLGSVIALLAFLFYGVQAALEEEPMDFIVWFRWGMIGVAVLNILWLLLPVGPLVLMHRILVAQSVIMGVYSLLVSASQCRRHTRFALQHLALGIATLASIGVLWL